ncbi:MAG: 3D domain-containing protein [Negativicutes bacterium]|nr:3D domain-containing protein [Negativicutes bacterium]
MREVEPINPAKLRKFLSGRRALVLLALLLISLVVTGFVWANKKVHIVADGKTIHTRSIHNSPEEILAQAGIYLGPKDEYRVTPGGKSGEPVTIEVFRAVPVTVLYNGRTEVVLTGKPTVREVVDALGIPKTTKTTPGENVRPTPNIEIKVVNVAEKVEVRELPVPRPVVRQQDGMLEKGIEGVFAEGADGRKLATVRVRYEDGIEVASEILTEKIIAEPKPQIIHVGTRETVSTYRGTLRFSRVMLMEATAYLPTDGEPHGLTFSGIPARRGLVAVDPRVIPLGTRLYIPGYGLALAADTGGAIIGNKIDLCVEDEHEAWNFGRRMIKVYVIAD